MACTAAETASDSRTKVVDYGLKKRLDHRPNDALNQELTEGTRFTALTFMFGPDDVPGT